MYMCRKVSALPYLVGVAVGVCCGRQWLPKLNVAPCPRGQAFYAVRRLAGGGNVSWLIVVSVAVG